MSWIRRETEKGAVQYICPHCHDYHEFREDFGGRTFSENYIFCRRCGARNGTGNAPTLTPPNEPRIINADKLAKRIAGHSNYHGDSILSAIYCAAEGKENNAPIRPIENPPNEWVSVEDAVPDPGVRVLAANGSFVGEAYMASNGAWMRHDGFPWEVDAWMPMPDRRPPEGDADA